MSIILSPRQLIKFGHRNELSLELRLQWQKLYGRDPYNDLRSAVRNRCLFWSVAIFGTACMFFALLLRMYNNNIGQPYGNLEGAISFAALGSLLFFLALWSRIDHTSRLAEDFCHQYQAVLEHVAGKGEDLKKVAKRLAPMGFSELRQLAREHMILATIDVLEHHTASVKDRIWYAAHAGRMADVTQKYDALAKFDLVYGGYDHFYGEARKWLAEKAKTEAVPQVDPV